MGETPRDQYYKSAKDSHLSHDHDSGAYAHAATIGAS
jgi:hypothetical protein